ncbi:hypothetical protein SLA2020_275800 [Shorea laevis]
MGNCLFGGLGEVIKVVTSNGGVMEFFAPVTLHATDNVNMTHNQIVRQGHIRSKSTPASLVAPYRMSFDYQGMLKRSYKEVFSPYNGGRFWKVKLVISPEQLLEILSQEGSTQELIESVRTVAKCGSGVSSLEFSDRWSLSSSRNASSKKDGLVDI